MLPTIEDVMIIKDWSKDELATLKANERTWSIPSEETPSFFLCGSCGEPCADYKYNEETDVDECPNCQKPLYEDEDGNYDHPSQPVIWRI